MEEKIKTLRKVYESKKVPRELECFDLDLLDDQEKVSPFFANNSRLFVYSTVIVTMLVVVLLSLFSFFPESSVTRTIKGTFLQSDISPESSAFPTVIPSDIPLISKPSPTPTVTPSPTPTVIPNNTVPSSNSNSDMNKTIPNNDLQTKNPDIQFKQPDIIQKEVRGVSEEHRQNEEKEEKKNQNSSNSQSNSNKSKEN